MAGGGVESNKYGFLETILLKSFEVFSMKLVWMKKKKKKSFTFPTSYER